MLQGPFFLTTMTRRPQRLFIFLAVGLTLFGLQSCNKRSKDQKAQELYQTHCARCHITPGIDQLPRELWSERVLPEMAARMGIKEGDYDPMKGLAFKEMETLYKWGVFPAVPTLPQEDWEILKEYILSNAPESIEGQIHDIQYQRQQQFVAEPMTLDSMPGSYFTFLKYDQDNNKVWTGDISGSLKEYDFKTGRSKLLHQVKNAVTDFTRKDSISYITDVGILDPSELSTGKIFTAQGEQQEALSEIFHRPVNTLVVDLDKDGIDELVISEFGYRTGRLTLMKGLPSGGYERRMLLTQPGAIRAVAEDMNQDGKLDIVVITSQGDESITILYQRDDMSFKIDKAIRFSPIYGSSWFELVDFDNDGDLDVITVNGDNADKTYIAKPYHGLRIHINDGNNKFTEEYFYPLNGATRFVTDDFDQDGDYDLAVISTFPDYENAPDLSLVYLENVNPAGFEFKSFKFDESNLSRWFLLDKGDVDNDGDTDIILSAFTYVFTPVPDRFTREWEQNNVDMVVLKNRLK